MGQTSSGEPVRFQGGDGEFPGVSMGPVRFAIGVAIAVLRSDRTVLVDATGGASVATLPSAVGIPGRRFTVVKVDASANAVSVAGAGGETINGAATSPLSSQWDGVTVESNGSNWIASMAAGGTVAVGVGVVTVASSPYAVAATDRVLLIDASGGAVTINLPSGAVTGRALTMLRLDFSGNSVTVTPVGGENIDGAGSYVWVGVGSYVTLEVMSVGNDGIGFVNGWTLSQGSGAGALLLSTGPSIVPRVNNTVWKLGSYTASFQPYIQGFYHALPVTTAINFQLQSYMDALRVDTTAGNLVVTLNGIAEGQQHMIAKVTADANTVTITPQPGHTVNGAATLVLPGGARSGVILIADAAALDWGVFAGYGI